MPAITHLQARIFEDGASSKISGTSIALILFIGLIPAVALIWVFVWLLFFYGRNRTCWCTRRKTRAVESTVSEKTPSIQSRQQKLYIFAARYLPKWPFTTRTGAQPKYSVGGLPTTNPVFERPTTSPSRSNTTRSTNSFGSSNSAQAPQVPRPLL